MNAHGRIPAGARRGPPRPPGIQRWSAEDRGLHVERLRDLLRVTVVDATAATAAAAAGGARMPSESELMREFGEPRDVVREALSLLADEGLIQRRRGVGTVIVASNYTVDGTLPGTSTSLSDHAAIGAVGAQLLHWRRGPVPAVIADRLDDIACGDATLCMEYVLTIDGTPMGLITNYLRSGESAGMSPEDFGDDFYALLDHHGVDMHDHDIDMTAQAADARTAELLGIEPGSPTQLFEQTLRNSSGARFDFAIGRLRREIRLRITGIGRVLPVHPAQ
ncbi:GntR family transcriptional regulator [Williamsia herbipolensis]|uniref:GntR family transcriptional regulator n=1 Tax=Williamsia herbipolensis TaxID=1603258 RepID=A0AAU4K532_9NOCA|nr:GntR family transcriptional regulator [Williamsia herbipolensis]